LTASGERPLRLLYIDDDAAFGRLVSRALGKQGFDVVLAPGGNEGLSLLDQADFDVVAVDHYMPGRSGESTLAEIVARHNPPPVVYVTAADEGRIAFTAIKLGAADYVLKDSGDSFFDLLGETLRQACAAARAQRERLAAQAEVIAQRDRAEMLLQEMNHRVANSLALVSSLAQMQASALPEGEGRDAMRDFQRRVTAISQVHRRLYTSDTVNRVSLDSYLSGLIEELRSSLPSDGSAPRLVLVVQPVIVSTDKAISIGVIVSELVTNACKYAYPDRRTGEVRIHLSLDGGLAELCVEDDGVGFDSDQPRGTGLGGRLLKAMAKGLKTRLDYVPEPVGTRAVLRFKP